MKNYQFWLPAIVILVLIAGWPGMMLVVTQRQWGEFAAAGVTAAVLIVVLALGYGLHNWLVAAQRAVGAERQAKEAAQAESEAKSRFLAYLSHEIRNPVSNMAGLIELLQATNLDNRQQKYVSALDYSACSMLTVLNNALDFAKLEAGKMSVENVSFTIDSLMAGVSKILQSTAVDKGLSFSTVIDPLLPPVVSGDLTHLQQVLLNIAGNAVKFTETGRVEVKAACSRQEGTRQEIKFTVTDTGIGLEPDEVTQLFRPFVQITGANTRQHAGSGLGLSIAASLVELMGGAIGVSSKKGKGSTFWFTVPVAAVPGGRASADSDQPAPCHFAPVLPAWLETPGEQPAVPGHVLLVEDNPVNQQVILAQLKYLGLTADVAANGQKAVDLAARNDYQLIFMDCGLPVLDGLSAVRLIREQEAATGRRTPIIALTANALPQEGEGCLAAGMDDWLVKPVAGEDLRQIVGKWLTAGGGNGIALSVLQELKALAENAREDITVFIDIYLEELPIMLAGLRQAIQAGDDAQIRAAAHGLKSVSATIGASRLAELFSRLEKLNATDGCKQTQLMLLIEAECRQVGTDLKNAAGLL